MADWVYYSQYDCTGAGRSRRRGGTKGRSSQAGGHTRHRQAARARAAVLGQSVRDRMFEWTHAKSDQDHGCSRQPVVLDIVRGTR